MGGVESMSDLSEDDIMGRLISDCLSGPSWSLTIVGA